MMRLTIFFKTVIMSFLILCSHSFFSQTPYHFTLNKQTEICLKANASIEISGTVPADTIEILWSNGQVNSKYVYDLSSGDYSVRVKIKHLEDTVPSFKDTTLYFSIDKELCQVSVDKYFSPNDDNYHDVLNILNAEYHPNFEFCIFNRWGQQIHSQKRKYTPWDGKWLGVDQPDGAYYYIFFYDDANKNKLVKGDITILR